MKVLIVSHITDLAGPTEAAVDYFAREAESVDVLLHPLPYCMDRASTVGRTNQGNWVFKRKVWGSRLPNLITYLRDALLTLIWGLRFGQKYDVCLGVDPLNCFVALLLKKLGRVERVYFYTIDWMPTRFSNPVLNRFYHLIDQYCVNHCDAAWNLSPKICEVRAEQGLEPSKNLLVPVGVEFDKIQLPAAETKVRATKLVLLGALAPSKGVDLVIEAFAELKKALPEIELYVIGKTPEDRSEDGVTYEPYEPRLQALGEGVYLLGRMNHDEVLAKLPHFDLGLALYKPYQGNLSAWADPSRVKDYLACGLPTLVTSVPPIAKDIEENVAGRVVEYTSESLAQALLEIAESPELFREMRQNALRYMESYNWKDIFSKAIIESQVPSASVG
ncbi:MAG: glycosyltransferase [bacterium]|nr:glycosyltransferase [bacterium]